MLKKIFFSLVIFVLFSCQNNKVNPAENLDEKLKTTLSNYLNQNKQNLTKKLRYEVKSVNYFQEGSLYLCEFKVSMQSDSAINSKIIDTEGVMKFRINKDLKIVSRDY